MFTWCLKKLSMDWANYSYLYSSCLVFNKMILIFISMNFSCLFYKFFFIRRLISDLFFFWAVITSTTINMIWWSLKEATMPSANYLYFWMLCMWDWSRDRANLERGVWLLLFHYLLWICSLIGDSFEYADFLKNL